MLTVIGEAVIDLVRDPDGRFTAHPGGSPLNVAVGLARLGERTHLLARFAKTGFGRTLRAHAEANQVDVAAAVIADEPATLAVVTLATDGSAEYDFYTEGTADWQWTEAELAHVPPDTQILHAGSLACFLVPGADAVAGAMRSARARGGLVSFDPNIRASLLATAEETRARVAQLVSSAHVVKASDEDLSWLYPGLTPAEVAHDWLDLGAGLVCVTLGPGGAFVARPGGDLHRPAPEVLVVDTVGAGDAFMAGLLSALVRAGVADPAALARLEPPAVETIVDEAIAAAALTCTRAGANPPTRAELDEWLSATG